MEAEKEEVRKRRHHRCNSIPEVGGCSMENILTLSTQEREVGLGLQEREVKLEVEQLPLIGNTVRLKGEFRDFPEAGSMEGQLFDPDNVVLKIYTNRKQLGDDIIPERIDKGRYQYDYVIPYDVSGYLYFEFCGKVADKPVLGRAGLERLWV